VKTQIKKALSLLADVSFAPFVYPSAFLLKTIRKHGLKRMPRCRTALLNSGVLPVIDNYYEPFYDPRKLSRSSNEQRSLPGIEWNVGGQLQLLEDFRYAEELNDVPLNKAGELVFYVNNGLFNAGDAEFFYQIIRSKKPKRLYEIGSGNSTLMAAKAIRANRSEMPAYRCEHVCIEPYEMPWLEKLDIRVIRNKVEDVGVDPFAQLDENDILFIDSSHVVRPQGDVVFEYLQLLPTLKKGVIVHIHDIFSPRDYVDDWLHEEIRVWDEQYLLEAFLTSNRDWKIIGAVNFLHHNHYEQLKPRCPFLEPAHRPASFYIQKVG
jgi:Methyltransferase domain